MSRNGRWSVCVCSHSNRITNKICFKYWFGITFKPAKCVTCGDGRRQQRWQKHVVVCVVQSIAADAFGDYIIKPDAQSAQMDLCSVAGAIATNRKYTNAYICIKSSNVFTFPMCGGRSVAFATLRIYFQTFSPISFFWLWTTVRTVPAISMRCAKKWERRRGEKNRTMGCIQTFHVAINGCEFAWNGCHTSTEWISMLFPVKSTACMSDKHRIAF